MKFGSELKIKALKHPNIPHYEWSGELLELNDDYAVLMCKPRRRLNHYTKGRIFVVDNYTIEIYSFKEWFTLVCQIENGSIVSYYCNIAKPSILNADSISYVDLDLDFVKRRYDLDFFVIDEDEFIENSIKYKYSKELISQTKSSLMMMQSKLKMKQFPFDGTIEKFIPHVVFETMHVRNLESRRMLV